MKKEEITRKRNLQLSNEVEELKVKLAMKEELNSESSNKAKELLRELEIIKTAWLKSLEEVEKQKEEYSKLIQEVKDFKNSVKGRNAIERWFYDRRK